MESKKTKKVEKNLSEKNLAGAKLASEKDSLGIKTRGRVFEGIVAKKFPKRVVIEFERIAYVQKYERFYKKITRIHARLSENMEKEVNVGDLVRVQECRPLSKIIHHLVIAKVKSNQELKNNVSNKNAVNAKGEAK